MNLGALAARLTLYERLMRLDKPIGTLLLLWPTLWALWLAGSGRPSARIVWIFVLGTLLMRSAGCVMNDIADWRFDSQVKRTRDRPLATGEVSRGEAYGLAAALTLAAFALVLSLNRLTVLLSVVALALAATYPLTKRNLAVWAIAYDTEYAMVDRDDDVRIGIKTAAITLGRYDVVAVMVCYGVTLGLLGGIGLHRGMGAPFYLGLAGAAALMAYHYRLIRGRGRDCCFRAFNQNNWVGAAVFAGIFVDFAARQGLPWM
jgi:4-hydroxybenzoate polyprenyltransferase